MSKKFFIFLIIFLIVLGFLIFNFRKTEEVEAQEYCAVSGNCNRQLIGVQFKTINTSSGCSASGYGDYTYLSAVIEPNETVTLSVTVRYYSGSALIKAIGFFDWNRDFDFSGSGERISLGSCIGSDVTPCTITTNITVPATASFGSTRMRIVAGGIEPYIQPCGTGYYNANGEAEDYTIIIDRAPTISSVSDSPDPQKGGSAVTFSSSASDPDTGDTIKLYVCKDSGCTNCSPITQTNCWAVTVTGVTSNPSASYTCPSCTVATNNYWAKVCDQDGVCSSIIPVAGASFTCKKENGCAETVAANCFSGFAVDGYCCNLACTGTCQTCAAYGGNPAGTCSTRTAGDNVECTSCYRCDGININCQPVTCPTGEYCGDDGCIKPNLYGFAWSENIGWISFNSKECDPNGDGNPNDGPPQCIEPGRDYTANPIPTYGVYLPLGAEKVDATSRYFKGYAWSANIGWVKFNPPSNDISNLIPDATQPYDRVPAYIKNQKVSGFIRACSGAANTDCTGAANPAAGGWDGFINTNSWGTFPHQVELYKDTSTGKWTFKGWAWGGGGTSAQNAVVGWISFNCLNRGVCTAATAEGGPSNYKVTYQPPNDPPTVSNAQLDGTPNYCTETGDTNGVQKGQVGFKWTYTDFEGDDQERYWLQIATDSGFNTRVIDCQVPNSVVAEPDVGKTITSAVTVVSSGSTELANACNDGLELGNRTLAISYGGTYYWRAASKAGTGNTNWSEPPAVGPSFTTPAHAYPYIDFHWVPLHPDANQSVNFYDDSVVYGGASKSSWSWVFPSATPSSSTLQNPTGIQFQSAGPKSVSLTVEDSDGAATADPNDFKCTDSKIVQANLPLPKWKEIPPTF